MSPGDTDENKEARLSIWNAGLYRTSTVSEERTRTRRESGKDKKEHAIREQVNGSARLKGKAMGHLRQCSSSQGEQKPLKIERKGSCIDSYINDRERSWDGKGMRVSRNALLARLPSQHKGTSLRRGEIVHLVAWDATSDTIRDGLDV